MIQKGRSSDSALSWPRHAPPAEMPPLDRDRMVGNTEVIQITEACDSSPGPPAAPSQFVFQPSVKRNAHGENGLERRERAVSGTIEAA
jgi:hypothetical protein